jgi:3-oxoacyl-[acyl-carrier-protein] synthase II
MARHVVITGVGPLTPIGTGRDAFWDALRSGESGVCRVDDRIDLTDIDVKIGAPVSDFDPLEHMDRRRARRLDRAAQFALVAAQLALTDAGLERESLSPERSGVIAGTGIGGLQTMEENYDILYQSGPRRVSPFFVPRLMPNAIAGEIAIEHGLRGPNFGVVSACASSAHAIGVAGEMIRSGLVDCVIAGGAEAVLVRIAYAGFTQIGAVSKRNDDPQRASRPFDKDRDGFVMGEGAGFLILEEHEAALARGAHIYGELAGFGMTADAHHITAPLEDGAGAAQAIRSALDRAQIKPEAIDYINAHGTSTPLNDRAETVAIKTALGPVAKRVKISSTKSQIGHLLGAAGSVEAIATLLSMEHGFIPATLNYESPDPECDLDYTPEGTARKIEVALSNSFGFGGQNAALIFHAARD